MRLSDVVTFRKDLLFNGAVQTSWLENDKKQALKAAEHFVFHGPDYHGVVEDDFVGSTHKLVDTANFVLEVVKRLNGDISDDPFMLAIAGYGTGKSHLALTLASLVSEPNSSTSQKILSNIFRASNNIGREVTKLLKNKQPYLVVTINGMHDFDLSNEIIRQVLIELNNNGLDTTVLENLRPRFKTAINFTEAFYKPLKDDFMVFFGMDTEKDSIISYLKAQDEVVFSKVSQIYEQKMGSPIHAVGQESLHDFIRVAKETYCGNGKPFAGILILFDEFGRYLEFAVQKPHVAGSGSLQQLFECVQSNEDKVFLTCFIQYELKAYISRVAPELREDVNRYVTRYDAVRKVRLSTNIETVIANLLEKKDPKFIKEQIASEDSQKIHSFMKRYFPDLRNHSLWMNQELFEKIVHQGCWPIHPLSTWVLYKLSTVGKSLQQRSALSLLAEVYNNFEQLDISNGRIIVPTDFCNEAMISEFLASERYGQQGAIAHAYENVINKYQHELSNNEKNILKAVLMSAKIGYKVNSKEECCELLSVFSGLDNKTAQKAIELLEREYAVLDWNEQLRQYEITGDAVPRRAFLSYLEGKVSDIDNATREDIFIQNYKKWAQKEVYNTDFGPNNIVATKDWNYNISFSNVSFLEGQVEYAIRTWRDAINTDDPKGQLIYCYVGPQSNIDTIKNNTLEMLKKSFIKNKVEWDKGAPISIIFLHDKDGIFGQKIAEYWVLQERMDDEDIKKYANFILERKSILEKELENQFNELEKDRNIVFATEKNIQISRIKNMLTNLFEVIYPQIIPFDFDGFHTAKGNAAKDSQLFTKELIVGRLDKEWIATCNQKQRNRAHNVLVVSWGIFEEDGSVRLKPTNNAVRVIIELLDEKLTKAANDEEKQSINLGEVMRLLCAPPFGCNIASGGLLLALFIGRRKERLNLLKNNQPISIENWLQDAMPKNFFDLSVLDSTELIMVSEENLNEWENLLEDWSIEKTILGKIEFEKKAQDLLERITIPPQLFYKYKHLLELANTAKRQLAAFDNKFEEALSKVLSGKEKNEVNLLSWGGTDFVELYNEMILQKSLWRSEQIKEVEANLASARVSIQNIFPQWLRRQKVTSIEHLNKFSFSMKRICNNLEKLNLIFEKEQLEQHVAEIEKHIQYIEMIERLSTDIESFIGKNVITSNTKISTLKHWLGRIQDFAEKIEQAKHNPEIVKSGLKNATNSLAIFQKSCKEQIETYFERMQKIYEIEGFKSANELSYWREEIASLIAIYEGEDKDVMDLKQVQKQLDLAEKHYKRLNAETLNENEFEEMVQKCIEETLEEFFDDVPPLDHELIYKSIAKELHAKRRQLALEWMERCVPNLHEISKFSATEAQSAKMKLQNKPAFLSEEQAKQVEKAFIACADRLDQLEVEGLIIRFQALSPKNQMLFLEALSKYKQTS